MVTGLKARKPLLLIVLGAKSWAWPLLAVSIVPGAIALAGSKSLLLLGFRDRRRCPRDNAVPLFRQVMLLFV